MSKTFAHLFSVVKAPKEYHEEFDNKLAELISLGWKIQSIVPAMQHLEHETRPVLRYTLSKEDNK